MYGATSPLDRAASFPLASISKVFTSTLLALLVERRSIRLDSTLGELIDNRLPPPVAAITLEQLATHTSGLPRLPAGLLRDADPANPYAHVDAAALLSYLRNTAPGAIVDGRDSYEYSNFGYALLGAALEAASGKSYADIIFELIFQPLGMADSFVWSSGAALRDIVPGMDVDGKFASTWQMGAFVPAGGVVSNVADMARFMRTLLDCDSPIGAATQWAFEPRHSPAHGPAVALGWHCSEAIRWHNGETYSHHAMLALDSESHSGVLALWNAAGTVDDACMHVLDAKYPLVEFPAEVALSNERLRALAGIYDRGAARPFVITVEATRLRFSDPALGSFCIYPRDARTFFRRLSAGDYTFSIDASGEIILEHRNAGLTIFRAKRINDADR
jgi:CubicO group peptidase (beta-lactamase class C family)